MTPLQSPRSGRDDGSRPQDFDDLALTGEGDAVAVSSRLRPEAPSFYPEPEEPLAESVRRFAEASPPYPARASG